jgi:hypothetical protein
MQYFPDSLLDELRDVFTAEWIDEYKVRTPVSGAWTLVFIGFEPAGQRRTVVVRLTTDTRRLDVVLDAEDFGVDAPIPNSSSLSDVAFHISMLAEEQLWDVKPSDFVGTRYYLRPNS